jgi:hypothetical protein
MEIKISKGVRRTSFNKLAFVSFEILVILFQKIVFTPEHKTLLFSK